MGKRVRLKKNDLGRIANRVLDYTFGDGDADDDLESDWRLRVLLDRYRDQVVTRINSLMTGERQQVASMIEHAAPAQKMQDLFREIQGLRHELAVFRSSYASALTNEKEVAQMRERIERHTKETTALDRKLDEANKLHQKARLDANQGTRDLFAIAVRLGLVSPDAARFLPTDQPDIGFHRTHSTPVSEADKLLVEGRERMMKAIDARLVELTAAPSNDQPSENKVAF